jgi:hypothetical protein
MKRNLQIILTLAGVAAAGWVMASAIPNPEAGGGTNLAYINKTSKQPPTNLPALLKSVAAKQAASATPAAKEPVSMKPVDANDFKAFQAITDKNIFDTTRTGIRGIHPVAHHPKIDDFTLVGTMSYEKATLAFFDGSSSQYKGALKTNAIIAGYKLVNINSDYAELQSTNGKAVKMLVGTTISREDNGPWSAPSARADTVADSGSRSRSRESDDSSGERSGSDRSERRSSRRSSRGDRSSGVSDTTSATSSPSSNSSPSSGGGSEDEVIKRLMEKRAKEKGDQ